MLKVELFKYFKDLINFQFVEENPDKVKVICPSPLLADMYRKKWQDQSLGLHSDSNLVRSIEFLTVSKFSKDLLKEYLPDVELVRKSDLLLQLATIWKIKFSELSEDIFDQVFTQLTELRGFTVDLNLISEILEEFEPSTAEALKFFWLYMESEQIVDEHRANNLLANYLRSAESELPLEQNFIFLGFQQVNSGQVDFFKALSARSDVYVGYPVEVYKKSKRSDWINWLSNKDEVKFDLDELESEKKSVQTLTYPKNRLNQYIKNYESSVDDKNFDIYLAQKNPSLAQINEISLSNCFFKSPVDIFQTSINKVLTLLSEMDLSNTKESIEKLKGSAKDFAKNEDFKSLKCLSDLIKVLNTYMNFSKINESLSSFDLKILSKSMLLNAPRTSFIPLLSPASEECLREIKGMEAIEGIESNQAALFCVTSAYAPLRSFDESYSEKVREFLSSVGPLSRKEVDFDFSHYKLNEILPKKNITLLMELGLADHDLGWASILEGFELEEVTLVKKEDVETKDSMVLNQLVAESSDQKNYISATRLQSYIDCPRKYYFQYIEKLNTRPELSSLIRADQLGVIQHRIIELYFESFSTWDYENLKVLSEKTITEFLQKNGISLEEIQLSQVLIECVNYSSTAILALLKIKESDQSTKFHFEKELTGEGIRGFIDCVVETSEGIIIIDFKRSSGSIPTKKAFQLMDKIQLWFYLSHLPKEKDFLAWGYLNLSSLEDSLFFVNDNTIETVITNSNFLEDLTAKTLKSNKVENLDEELSYYSDLETQKVEQMEDDKDFLPKPLDSSVCAFCVVRNLCPKKSMGVKND